MSHFERGSERHPIPPGESALAMEAGGPSIVPGPGGPGRRAILKAAPDGEVVIVKVQDGDLTINGVRLGSEPTPLLHGDKVGVGGAELTFVDERRSGSTVFMAAMQAPAAPNAGAVGFGVATGATGGRLVCLTDGREYAVAGSSLVFGRDAACDIVVAAKDVSRRHAEILPTAKGYVLIDHSTNGTFVNDERIPGQRLLARGDLIRIGVDEFRFYAEQESLRESTPRRAALQATMHGLPAGEAQRAASPPLAERVPEAAAGVGGAGRPSQSGELASSTPSPPLASLLLRGGPHKGTRLSVRSAVANVGRAEYNDVMLDDASVSADHAKLQRRGGIWVLVDLESTNGTFVDGERVVGEAPLAPGSTVRFGEVRATFEPLDDALGMGTGAPKTSLLAREVVEALEKQVAPPEEAARRAVPETERAGPARERAAEPAPAAKSAAPGADSTEGRPPLIVPSGRGMGRPAPAQWSSGYRASMGARRAERVRVVLIGALIVVAVAVTALIVLLT